MNKKLRKWHERNVTPIPHNKIHNWWNYGNYRNPITGFLNKNNDPKLNM